MAADLEALRVATADRLVAAGRDADAVKLYACGRPLPLMCCSCGRPHEVSQSCRRRFCPVCARVASAERVALYAPLIAAMRWPVFATFTIRHGPLDSTADVFTQLLAGWSRFKKLGWFRKCVRGGVGAIEVSSPDPDADYTLLGGWNGAHPHIHALLDTTWLSVSGLSPGPRCSPDEFKHRARISQREVTEQWRLSCRCDAAGIFLRRAKPGTVEEVLKYALKPGALLDPRLDIGALIDAMSGRKLVVPFGSIRKALKIVRAEAEAAKPPLICECGAESWAFNPAATREQPTTSGVWFTEPRRDGEKFAAFARFKTWAELEI